MPTFNKQTDQFSELLQLLAGQQFGQDKHREEINTKDPNTTEVLKCRNGKSGKNVR